MEWRKCYLDLILVPLGFFSMIAYHVWLWHRIRIQPLTTIIGTNSNARRYWVTAIIKVINLFNWCVSYLNLIEPNLHAL